MANLGAEVSRALSAQEKGDTQATENAITRSMSIIEKILSFEEMKPRTGEINILKKILKSISENNTNFSPRESENLKSYFYPFALRLSI